MVQALWPTLVGLSIGLLGALLLGKLMSGLLYGVTAYDPLTMGAVSLLLFVVAALACIIPARRAAKVQPMAALREE